MTDIPADLVAAVREGRVVLFLGAGALIGAKNDKGGPIPWARDLAKELIESKYEDSFDRNRALTDIWDKLKSKFPGINT
jgi:hypothetical protein